MEEFGEDGWRWEYSFGCVRRFSEFREFWFGVGDRGWGGYGVGD